MSILSKLERLIEGEKKRTHHHHHTPKKKAKKRRERRADGRFKSR